MSVARTPRRRRIQMSQDRRYKKRDPVASARKLAAQKEKARRIMSRKK